MTHFLLTCALLLGSLTARATEVDDISTFYRPLADSEKILNQKTQGLIATALSRQFDCNRKIFARKAATVLVGNLFFGAVESFANDSPLVERAYTPAAESIYRGSRYQGGFVDTFVNLGPSVNVAGHRFGTDKLGHFMDMGWDLYQRTAMGAPVEELLRQSHREEGGLWGLYVTGVKSYGDVASNFDGHRFWRELIEPGPHAFLKCEGGRLRQVRDFRWSDYASSAWSEAINCNEYWSEEYAAPVARNIAELERAGGRRYACPIVPAQCDLLRAHYARWIPDGFIDQIISPGCR